MLFNKNNTGGQELRTLLGFLDASTNFDRWLSWISLSVRQITAVTGSALYLKADEHYNSDNYKAPDSAPAEPAEPTEPTEPPAEPVEPTEPAEPTFSNADYDMLVNKFQLANALFAYVRLLPSLDAGHTNNGRKKDIASDERALTAAEAYKDESNILSLAYEALDDLIQYAELKAFPEWINSPVRSLVSELLLPTPEMFNRYFALNSVRMYYTIVPIVREMQNLHIASTYTSALLAETVEAIKATTPTERQTTLRNMAHKFAMPALALQSMATAAERLPVEVFPYGVMTTQIIGTAKERKNADKDNISKFVASLRSQAERHLLSLQTEIEKLNGTDTDTAYVIEPKAVGKGFRF